MCPIVKGGKFGHTQNSCICLHTTTNSLLYFAAGPTVFCAFAAARGHAWPGSGRRSSACEADVAPRRGIAFCYSETELPATSENYAPAPFCQGVVRQSRIWSFRFWVLGFRVKGSRSPDRWNRRKVSLAFHSFHPFHPPHKASAARGQAVLLGCGLPGRVLSFWGLGVRV
jgi:hypothetical protein